jgi:hypothetical protein
MPPQIKQDLNRSGWETTDFPSVCENCLPENNYVQMLKSDHDAVSSPILKNITHSACPGHDMEARLLDHLPHLVPLIRLLRNAKSAQDPSQFFDGRPIVQLDKNVQISVSLAPGSRTVANAACSIYPSVSL